MSVLPWGLLEAGILTGKFLEKPGVPTRLDPARVKLNEQQMGVVRVVQAMAQESGRSMAQVAINWARQQGPEMIPILGARTANQLQDNLGVLEWALSPEQISRLDEASRIELGFPHGILEGNPYLFGATYDLIDRR